MTIEKLSPDEIEGLLGQIKTEEVAVSKNSLSKVQREALTELLAVSIGGSSPALSSIFSEQVMVSSLAMHVKHKDELFPNTQSAFFVVLGEYTGEIGGLQIVSVNRSDVESLVKLKDADNQPDNMEKQFQFLQEVTERLFASVSRSMSTVLEKSLSYSISGMDIIESEAAFPIAKFTKDEWFVEAIFQVKVGDFKAINFHQYISVRLAKQVVGVLTDLANEDDPEETQEMEFQSNNPNKTQDTNATPTIQSVQFSSFDETASVHTEPNNLDMLLDIPLEVTVELGRTKRMVKEILSISQGSIIELDKLAGEPVDILVNNKLIAVGEVVVIDENFGVRVTDILSTADRISKLR